MKAAFIVIFLVILGALLGYGIYKLIKKKYRRFIMQHSLAIKELLNKNRQYNFVPVTDYSERYTYDNYSYYSTISCQDYLIYQMKDNGIQIMNNIKGAKYNKEKYPRYCEDISRINCFGSYDTSIEKYNQLLLNHWEKDLFKKNVLKPKTDYKAVIKLYCSKLNGDTYAFKTHEFKPDEIVEFYMRLNNRFGDYYNDQDIWWSLCRVERGKVSNKLRFSIYRRDGYRCQCCGRSGTTTLLEIDHIKPIAKGGKTEYNNLQTLCRNCNKEKGDKYFAVPKREFNKHKRVLQR